MKDPRVEAGIVIAEVMSIGSSKDGRDESWRQMPRYFHMAKAARHAMTALMIELGIVRPDGEDHAKLALTRLAMALCIAPLH